MRYIGYFFGGLGLIAAALVFFMIAGAMGTAANVLSTPGRVINDTVRTENVINSYNGFYKLRSSFDTKISSIKSYLASTAGETDAGQLRIIQSNVFAMRTVCMDLANTYNNNAEKLTSSFFKDGRLPQQLDPTECE